jgi:low temperature requirement protein LtrA
MDGNQSYREKRERVPSRFELFFDLVFVAIAHQLSEVAAEHAGGPGLLLFVLVSIPPVWSTPWLNTLQTFL